MSLQSTARVDVATVRPAFAGAHRWAPVLDFFFNLPLQPGRAAAARAAGEAAAAGGELLVVGVGAGRELPMLSRSSRVTGVDGSASLMRAARERIARRRLSQVRTLQVMDAEALEFEHERFDVALAPYVMGVAQRPGRVLDEMWRVLRPGGQIVIVKHLAAGPGLGLQLEAWLEIAASLWGWSPAFPCKAVRRWLWRHPDAMIIESRRIAPFGPFTLLRVQKAAPVSEG